MPQAQRSQKRRRNARRTFVSQELVTCSGCKGTIPVRQRFWRGLTDEPWHPECRRTRVHPNRETRRFLHDNPVGQSCLGCDQEIEADEPVVHVLARPWHKECFRMP